MGKTYRNNPHGVFRTPRGHKQSIINGARKIVPSCWEDLQHSKESVGAPYKAAVRMMLKGLSVEDTAHKLCRKYHLSYSRALAVVKGVSYTVERIQEGQKKSA